MIENIIDYLVLYLIIFKLTHWLKNSFVHKLEVVSSLKIL